MCPSVVRSVARPLTGIVVATFASAALQPAAWAAPLSQGATHPTTLCLDTGHSRITRLCANVVVRYKIDALMDVPLPTFGLTWTPVSWTFNELGGARTLAQNKLPPALARALAAATLQLKGTALVDFSADAPLQYLQYQTNAAAAHDASGWTGVIHFPMDRWLFTPGQCGEGTHQAMETSQAMALYKLGVKSLSIDPRSNASLCKLGTAVSNLDQAANLIDRLCQAETGRRPSATTASGLCLPPTAAGPTTATMPDDAARQRWGALLDDGVPSVTPRPTLSMLDTAPIPTVLATNHPLTTP